MLKKVPNCFRYSCVLLLLFLHFIPARAQYTFHDQQFPEYASLYRYAQLADVGKAEYAINDVISGKAPLQYEALTGENTNIGFSSSNYWVRFAFKNNTAHTIDYVLETARPVTDLVDLYTVDDGTVNQFKSGDAMPFKLRSVGHRKPIFNIHIKAGQRVQCYLHLKSDGEVINLPLLIRSPHNFLRITTLEQLVFGIFYGILVIASIIYLFFFFGLKERSFLFYSLYVIFIGLMQFSLDGYFYQYITPDAGWFSNRAVIIFACISTFLLGRYAQNFLRIKNYSVKIYKLFKALYVCSGVLLALVLLVPGALEYSYKAANVLGLFVLILIIASVATVYIKTRKVDVFFTTGVVCLILGFVIFILNNFSLLPSSFFTENSSKFGTGLEVIFLSLSMANYIRNLKNEREEFNRLALIRSEEMNDLKSYFLSNISHELRTPLNAIMNLIDSISKETADEKIRKDCQVIKYSSHSLLSSVNDILDFSKIEKGELVLEKTNFEPVKVLEHLQKSAKNRAADQGLGFEFSKTENIPSLLSGDVVRLVQVVNNVLSNALKFTSEGLVKFHIDGETKPNNKATLKITITDTGVGIPKEKINSIFDSFTQDNIDNKRKFGGLGLGLYIVKVLVDMKGGTVELDSAVGKGTTCTITIDYDIANEPVAVQGENEIKVFDLKGKKILVVEDNAINQMVIKMITKKWLNTETVYANNGEEGVEALQSGEFDLILMDLQMPVMDGYEATIAIRNGEAGAANTGIPIIAVTADVMETTKQRVREIGMNDYLSKPLKGEALYDAVCKSLEIQP